MIKRIAWRLIRPSVEARLKTWVVRLVERWHLDPEAGQDVLDLIMSDLDRTFGR